MDGSVPVCDPAQGVIAMVYPRVSGEERSGTALTEVQRQRKAARAQRPADEIKLWDEIDGRGRRRDGAFEALDLKRANDSPAIGPGDKGSVHRLPALGADAVWLTGGPEAVEALAEKLGDDFVVTRNARLLFPEAPGFTQSNADITPQAAEPPEAFGERYEESGVRPAHRRHIRGRGVVCAVLDTGVDADRSDFAHRKADAGLAMDFGFVLSEEWARPPAEGRGFDLFGHGTHVCSIIAGQKGVAPQVGMVVAAAPRTRVTSNLVMLSIGLDWLLGKIEAESQYGRRVILNLSLGFPSPGDPDAPSGERYPKALETFNALIDAIVDLDVLVVAAIGNRRDRYVSPADRPDVLSVGAVTGDLKRLPFSGHVPEEQRPQRIGPRVMGFGHNVVGADRRLARGDKLWMCRTGTSQAAAYVSGIAALYWCQQSGLSALEVATILEENALPLDDASIRNGRGLARFNPKWKP